MLYLYIFNIQSYAHFFLVALLKVSLKKRESGTWKSFITKNPIATKSSILNFSGDSGSFISENPSAAKSMNRENRGADSVR